MRADYAWIPAVAASARRDGISGLARWWREELLRTLPPEWRDVLQSPRSIMLERTTQGWGAVARGGEPAGARASVLVDPAEPEAARATLASIFASSPLVGNSVWLALPADVVLVRQATFPLAAEGDLLSALAIDLDRLTPFDPESVCFDFRVIGRDVAAKTLVVEVVVASRAVVSSAVAELRGLGARVIGVSPQDGTASDTPAFNLLPAAERDPAPASRLAVASRALGVVAIGVLFVAMVMPVWQNREAAIALRPSLEAAKAGAAESERISRDIERLAAQHNFIVAKRLAQPSMTSVVEELSRVLPDGTWVQQMEVKPPGKTREIQIAGETATSSALIATLERSGTLANATFKSPLTKGSSPTVERYLLSAELAPRPLPNPVLDVDLKASPAAQPIDSSDDGGAPAGPKERMK